MVIYFLIYRGSVGGGDLVPLGVSSPTSHSEEGSPLHCPDQVVGASVDHLLASTTSHLPRPPSSLLGKILSAYLFIYYSLQC